jgi:hypothetical protein
VAVVAAHLQEAHNPQVVLVVVEQVALEHRQ